MRRFAAVAAFALAALASAAAPGVADTIALPDSTRVESFRLANGLRVVTRDVPLSGKVAICLAFETGTDADPAGREGLTQLLAKLQYGAATEAEPARRLDEMPRRRPLGWSLDVAPRITRMTETATIGQLPGVLHQVATRLRGVAPTADDLRAALAELRAEQAANLRDSVDRAIYFRARAMAEGADEAAIARRIACAGLDRLSLREAQGLLAARFCPANAVLCLVGDLRSYPMRALLEGEFGAIPAGTPLRPARPRPLVSDTRSVPFPGLAAPAGVVGFFAPALGDSVHPRFYAAALVYGTYAATQWSAPDPPLRSRFKYLLLDDPDLFLLYPPVGTIGDPMPQLLEEAGLTMQEGSEVSPPEEMVAALRKSCGWLLGGPLPLELLQQARAGGSVLLTLASCTATREAWGGEAFWKPYREQVDRAFDAYHGEMFTWFTSKTRRVALLLTPPAR